MKRSTKRRTLAVTSAFLLALAAGCGTESGGSDADDDTGSAAGFTPPDLPMKEEMGDMEGEVNILAWPGYAEDGSTDAAVDWVTPFEEETGCQANVKYFGTSDEAVSLMKTGEYDVVSASGDASLRMIAAGDVAPVNVDLVENYVDVYDYLKDRDWNSVDGQMYGVPHGYGANLLMWRTDLVESAPTSWSVVFEGGSEYAGKVTAYDSPIYIADAAMYLMETQPDLGIEHPYSLDEDQLAAAVDLLKKQKENVGEYWSDYLKEVQAFTTGDSVVGTTWQVIANVAQGEGVPVDVVLPEEGATGWSDTWMVGADSPNTNCAYAWMNHIISPEANAAVAEYFGEAPSNAKACDIASEGHCETFHAGDEEYASKLWYWTTPIEQCLDGRTDVKCTDYGDWTQAWTEVKG
ncbi:spermidine/putrescine ABC transporter substrate-binding protein [Nocardioides psychrotolerans]|uniref:Putative spermidine/putrescine transport system substrate-binding protein n=1 Tax=Nocardioides psychrotolerans TaxID=1005945 RepID=A0A1I3D055_9ACTN|nr:ABC transporter substrate-binding protein [Nocardioides psychrotolerans]GEP36976.1 spermidine/putrescine ABC transporter substrate-binding protein [Nocardioides psychrotolerans]SFH80016.1 putative spermidine/putrescine transport system substrate-binding protein [Nocardioides psychrotolerans]